MSLIGLGGTHRAKVIIVGDPNCGKTSLTDRYINNYFTDNTLNTIGVEYFTRTLNYFWGGKSISLKLDFWDTAGQESFQSVTLAYYRDADSAILVFDLGCKDSYIAAQNYWYQQIQCNCPTGTPIFLVGNKADTKTDVSSLDSEAKVFAEVNQLNYFRVSAKTGEGVQDLFETLISNLKRKTDQLERQKPPHLTWIVQESESVNTYKPSSKKGCC